MIYKDLSIDIDHRQSFAMQILELDHTQFVFKIECSINKQPPIVFRGTYKIDSVKICKTAREMDKPYYGAESTKTIRRLTVTIKGSLEDDDISPDNKIHREVFTKILDEFIANYEKEYEEIDLDKEVEQIDLKYFSKNLQQNDKEIPCIRGKDLISKNDKRTPEQRANDRKEMERILNQE